MDSLFKYYSNESDFAIKNLENQVINFTPLESLNDPFEGMGQYLYPKTQEDEEYWKKIGSDVPELIAKRISEDHFEMENFKYRVFSATTSYDNSLMWAHYANSHRGFCIEYDVESIKNHVKQFKKIDYSDKLFVLNDHNLEDGLFVKDLEWKYEDEYRALYELKCEDVRHEKPDYFCKIPANEIVILNGHAQTNNLETLCSDKYIVKECKVKAIYLGIRMSVKEIRKMFEIGNELKIPVYQMQQANNNFLLEKEQLNSVKIQSNAPNC